MIVRIVLMLLKYLYLKPIFLTVMQFLYTVYLMLTEIVKLTQNS